MVRCLRTPKGSAEKVRRQLISEGILDTSFRIGDDGDHVLIPLTSDVLWEYDLIDAHLEPVMQKETDYRNITDVPCGLKELLPASFDIIGDIAVMKLSEELVPYAQEIGDALLIVSPSLRAVMADSGVKGDLRIREVRMMAGPGTSETIHKEFGVTMIIDPAKVYFNPRLSSERMRIAGMVKEGETVIDMFAGAAPFPLMISKHSDPEVIYSIDLNPDAFELMKRNIGMNRTSEIVPLCGDSRIMIKELPSADRIIMNLPRTAYIFLSDALQNLKKGGMIHLYMISEKELFPETVSKIMDDMKEKGFDICTERMIELKSYSPTMGVYVLDLLKK
jgi:tRNA (guanine37-N1)-methyltransferase